MKRILGVILLIMLGGCYPNKRIYKILESPEHRGLVYHGILNNDAYRSQLVDSLRTNDKTKPLMKEVVASSDSKNK